jgi:hypothetical protein
VVNRGGRLALSGYAVTVTGMRAEKTIPGPDGSAPTVAKGVFLIVDVRVTDTGRGPLEHPVNASFVTATATYDASGFAEGALQPLGVFPLKPGKSTRTHFAFDIPAATVADARSHGALELPVHPDATPATDTAVGISRLGG